MPSAFQGRRRLRGVLPSVRMSSPRSLGADFTRLWSAAALTNVGDGVLLAAGPLLVAEVSPIPAAVAGAVVAQQLPWLLFALYSGALVDRLDRRRVIATVNATRAVALTALAATVLGGAASLPVLYAVLFVLGTAETLADTASSALLVSVVDRDDLGRANARLFATFTLGNQLLGPPLGALLFVTAHGLPFATHAAGLAGGAVLVARIRTTPHLASDEPSSASVARRAREGVRWLWHHPGLRALAVSIAVMNVTFMAAFATWVLYAHERLGLGDVGFGLLITAGAVGGLSGSWAYRHLEARFGRVLLVRAGLVVEGLTHLVLAVTHSPIVAFATMAVFGVHTVVWGAASTTVRQRAVPEHLLGRVTSVYLLASVGGAAIGATLGGLLSQTLGLAAPFWIATAAITALTTLTWRQLGRIDPDTTE